jgi:hypothetical protein
VGLSPDRVKPKTMKSVGVASPLTTQYYRERAKTDWLGIIKEIGQVTVRNSYL